jgi:hypothetical protein
MAETVRMVIAGFAVAFVAGVLLLWCILTTSHLPTPF